MDQTICPNHASVHPRDDAPFADERRRYLHYCAEHGATPASLTIKRNELLWIARRLDPSACQGIGIEVLQRIGQKRRNLHAASTAARRVIDIGRPWLRFLGWWREPAMVSRYQCQLDQYLTWMRDERGFTLSTVDQWRRMIGRFLRWCEQTDLQLSDLRTNDLDEYFATQGTGRWSRVSVANTASGLRAFLRYAATQGMCADGLAASICRPRIYQQGSLPYAPDWSDVQRMLADADTDKSRDIVIVRFYYCLPSTACAVAKSRHCALIRSIGPGARFGCFA